MVSLRAMYENIQTKELSHKAFFTQAQMYKHKGTHFETARFLGLIFNRELARLVYLCLWVDFLKPKKSHKTSHFLLSDAMFCTMFLKNIAPQCF